MTLAWETVSEQDNAGFNVYRGESAEGPWAKVNAALIPAAAPGSSEGYSYTWVDAGASTPEKTYYYLLEDLDLNGAAARHGPVSATVAAVGPKSEPNAIRLSGFGALGPALPLTLPAALPLAGLGLAAAVVGAAVLRRRM